MANEIYVFELSATVAAIRAIGDQLRVRELILFSDNAAAAGALVKASDKVPIILATVECFWTQTARMSIPRWIERVPSMAIPADAPSRWASSISDSQAKGELLSLRRVLQLSQVPEAPGMSIDSLSI